MAREAGSS